MKKTADELNAEGLALLRRKALVVVLHPSQEHLAVEAQEPFIRVFRRLINPHISRFYEHGDCSV